MIGAFFVKRTGSLSFVEDVNTGSGIAYAAEIKPDTSVWHGIELDYLRVRKELTVGTTSTGPYIKTAGAAADINNNSTTVQATKVLLTTGMLLSDWRATGDLTKIDGGKIYTGSIITSALAFVPLISAGGTGAIVATINASAEGIRISGSKITIDGNVSFTSGYDPTTKVPAGGAAADVNANLTTISGGKITANSITADRLNVTTLSAITANLGTVTAGTLTSVLMRTAASGARFEFYSAAGIGNTGARVAAYNSLDEEIGCVYAHASDIIYLAAVKSSASVGIITAAGKYIRGDDIYGGFDCSGHLFVLSSLNAGNSKSAPYFTIDGSGAITKVNNVVAAGNTGKVLRSNGISYTPANLALTDLTAITASKIAVTDASGYVTASAIASSELFTPAYGELYDAVSTSTISTNGSTYVKWTGSTVGNCKGVTGSTANDNLTIDSGQGGKYLITYSVTFKANAIDDYYWAINQGGSAVSKTRMVVNATAANTQFNVCGCAIVTLSAGDTIDLGCYATNGRTVTVIYANLSITKLSN